jgi:hypothetical protein
MFASVFIVLIDALPHCPDHYSEIACLIIIIGPDWWHWVPRRRAMRRA